MYTEHIKKSIQFNNKDVHLNKRINEAKNSMKCDAIHHRTAVVEVVKEKICQLTPFSILKITLCTYFMV